jgi:hypothetical protein
MKLMIMRCSPVTCHLLSLTSKYSPEHSVLKCPQSICSSLNVRDQEVSLVDVIIIILIIMHKKLYILYFSLMLLDSRGAVNGCNLVVVSISKI